MSKSRRNPPYLQDYFDKRDGRRYLYFRKRVPLPLPIGSEEFWAAYKAALADKSEIGAARTVAGSISAALVAYYATSAWNDDLSPGTRTLRKPILEHFRARYGTWLLRQLTENFLVAYLESLKPHAAHNHSKTLRGLLRHAKHDVTRNIRASKAKSTKHASWTADMVAQYEAHHAIGTKARLCFALGKYTGAGRAEISRIGPQHVKDSVIEIPARQKTGVPARVMALRAIFLRSAPWVSWSAVLALA